MVNALSPPNPALKRHLSTLARAMHMLKCPERFASTGGRTTAMPRPHCPGPHPGTSLHDRNKRSARYGSELPFPISVAPANLHHLPGHDPGLYLAIHTVPWHMWSRPWTHLQRKGPAPDCPAGDESRWHSTGWVAKPACGPKISLGRTKCRSDRTSR